VRAAPILSLSNQSLSSCGPTGRAGSVERKANHPSASRQDQSRYLIYNPLQAMGFRINNPIGRLIARPSRNMQTVELGERIGP